MLTFTLAVVSSCGLFAVKEYEDAITMWLPTGAPSQVSARDYSLLTGRPRPRSMVVLLDAANATSIVQAVDGGESADEFGADSAEADAALLLLPVRTALEMAITIHETITSSGLANVSASTGLSAVGAFSPLVLWSYSREVLASDPDPEATLRAVLSEVGVDSGVTGASLASMLVLHPGGIAAMSLAYTLDGRASAKPRAVAFERTVRAALASLDLGLLHSTSGGGGAAGGGAASSGATAAGSVDGPAPTLHFFSEAALSDDLDAAVGTDVMMIAASFALMSCYMSFFLGRHRDALRSRANLAGTAVFSVVLATFGSFGLAALLGVEYNDNVNMGAWRLGLYPFRPTLLVCTSEPQPHNTYLPRAPPVTLTAHALASLSPPLFTQPSLSSSASALTMHLS